MASTVITETGQDDVHANRGALRLLKSVVGMLVQAAVIGMLVGAVGGILVTRHFFLVEIDTAHKETASARAEAARLSQAIGHEAAQKREALATVDKVNARLASTEVALRAEKANLMHEREKVNELTVELKTMSYRTAELESSLSKHQARQAATFFAELSNDPICRATWVSKRNDLTGAKSVSEGFAVEDPGGTVNSVGWRIAIPVAIISLSLIAFAARRILTRDRSPIIHRGGAR
ncbi:MAG: hypothetical protein WAM82_02375 [Thermoanaerobaculia bacterium]